MAVRVPRLAQLFRKMSSEFIPDNVSEQDVKEEANRRASKCGYCTREGNPTYKQKISEGWTREYEQSYERVFGHR